MFSVYEIKFSNKSKLNAASVIVFAQNQTPTIESMREEAVWELIPY